MARTARAGGKTTNDRTRVVGAPGVGARCRNQGISGRMRCGEDGGRGRGECHGQHPKPAVNIAQALTARYHCLTLVLILRTFVHRNILLPIFCPLYNSHSRVVSYIVCSQESKCATKRSTPSLLGRILSVKLKNPNCPPLANPSMIRFPNTTNHITDHTHPANPHTLCPVNRLNARSARIIGAIMPNPTSSLQSPKLSELPWSMANPT